MLTIEHSKFRFKLIEPNGTEHHVNPTDKGRLGEKVHHILGWARGLSERASKQPANP